MTQDKLEKTIQGNFSWNKPEVYTSFVQGAEAEAIYNSLKGNMSNSMSYEAKTQTLIGSQVFAAARIDSILRPLGIRVANLRDLSRPEVIEMVRDKFYTDAPALVLRSMNDSYKRNLPIIRQLAEAVENKNGSVKLPVLITGFDVKEIKDDNGYGIALIPRGDFQAVHDMRLHGENSGKKFTDVDELGLPKFDRDGKRIWYTRNQGVSRLCLYRSLNADSCDENLAISFGDGRVVLVSGEATQKNLEGKL
jgi:hypothetical protein